MSNQSARQASVRAITDTEFTYEGDWMALFDQSLIPAGEFNGRFLAWLNMQIPEPKTNLPDAMASYAINVAGVSCWNEVREIGGLPPPTPGPLDFTSDESTDELTVNFDLAAPIAALGVIIAIEGTYTGIEATHGGEPLTLVRDELNVAGQTLTAMFIGNGLTIEEAPLVITILGGAVGKAWIGRINDDYGYSNIASAWDDGDTGTSAASKTMTVSGVDGTGKLISVWGTDTDGRAGFVMPLAEYATQFSAKVVGGDKTAVTGWTTTARWSEAGGVYTHTGASSGISKVLSPTVTGPIGFSADVTLAAGASMTIIMVPTVGTPTQRTIYGPYSGKWYEATEDFLDFQSLAVMAASNTTIENMSYIENPRLLIGSISRSIGNATNGKNATWGSVNVARYSETAIEVHDATEMNIIFSANNNVSTANVFNPHPWFTNSDFTIEWEDGVVAEFVWNGSGWDIDSIAHYPLTESGSGVTLTQDANSTEITWTGGTPWTPALLGSNINFWHDASDLGTITHTAGAVSLLADKSPNNYNWIQNTGSNQMLTGTRTLNGLNVLEGDGTKFMDRSSTLMSNFWNDEEYTFLVVYAVDDLVNSFIVAQMQGGSCRGGFRSQVNFNQYYSNSNGGNLVQINRTGDTGQHIVGLVRSGLDLTAIYDDLEQTGDASDLLSLDNLRLFGSNESTPRIADGVFAEDVCFAGSDIEERTACIRYLKNKWGTP